MSEKKKKKKGEIGLKTFKPILLNGLSYVSRYAGILFLLLIAGVYSFVLIRINSLANIQPSQKDIDAQTSTTPIPRVDPKVALQLQNLEDNSVNVQTLFDQARNNPFQ
jgi:hypothetical protein